MTENVAKEDPPGPRVVIHGLTRRRELNGLFGHICAAAPPGANGVARWQVRLDGQDSNLSISLDNVRPLMMEEIPRSFPVDNAPFDPSPFPEELTHYAQGLDAHIREVFVGGQMLDPSRFMEEVAAFEKEIAGTLAPDDPEKQQLVRRNLDAVMPRDERHRLARKRHLVCETDKLLAAKAGMDEVMNRIAGLSTG